MKRLTNGSHDIGWLISDVAASTIVVPIVTMTCIQNAVSEGPKSNGRWVGDCAIWQLNVEETETVDDRSGDDSEEKENAGDLKRWTLSTELAR